VKFTDYESSVLTILKIGFGWNGIIPEKMTYKYQFLGLMQTGWARFNQPLAVAQLLAKDLLQAGAVFNERIDGQQNTFKAGEILVF
jgi:hypothetical protein